jgi:hypothetical protein
MRSTNSFSYSVACARSLRALTAVGVLVSFSLFSGCTGSDGGTTTGGLQVSSLTATPGTVDDGSTTVVEGTVTTNGVVTANKLVTFTVSPSTAGSFSPASVTSDASGIVATVFTATSVGSATITASVEGGGASTTPVTIQSSQSSGSGNISVNVSSSLLLADGATNATVTITVRDALSNPAPDGTIIRLTAGEKFVDIDGNGYWSSGIDSLVFDVNGNGDWDANGTIVATAVVAGGAGAAVVTYTSGTTASTVYIHASVNDGAFTGDMEASIQLTPDAAVNSIYLDADSIHIAVKQTGGFETTRLTAWCYDLNGNPVPEGITVSFVITDGPGGGENIANLGYGPYTSVTNSQGMVSAPISSGTVSGTMRIRATSDTVLSNTTQIVIDAGPPAQIEVGVDTCNIRYWRLVNQEVGAVAVVGDIYNNPVTDSTAVYFTTDESFVMAHQVATRDHKGVAPTTWISAANDPGDDGIVWIIAETSGGTVKDSVAFINSDFLDSINVIGWPSSLYVDGEDNADFTLLLYDLNNNPVINFLEIDHTERFLTISIEKSENQCFGSFSSATVKREGPLNRDYLLSGAVDDGIGAIDNVTFFLENGFQSKVCTLLTGSSYSKNSSIDELVGSLSGGQSAPFGATVKDRFGNPLGSHTLVASASAGTITTGTQSTNLYGEAFGFQFTAPLDTLIKEAVIVVFDTDPRGNNMRLTKKVVIVN